VKLAPRIRRFHADSIKMFNAVRGDVLSSRGLKPVK